MAIDKTEEVRNLKIELVPDALHPAPTTINHQPEQPLQHSITPPSGETAPTTSIQSLRDETAPNSLQLLPSLLIAYPPQSALPPKHSDNSSLHFRDIERPADIPMPPALSSSISTTSRREGVIENPRPPTTPPTTPPMSSPSSPSRAFDKFLSHYSNRGSALETPKNFKEMQPADSQDSVMSSKERIRAEKRAEVCAEAAEWEELRRREKKSKSRTKSPPQVSMTTQEEMSPPPPLSPPPPALSYPRPAAAIEPIRKSPTSIAFGDSNASMENPNANARSDPMSESSTSNQGPVSQVICPVEELQPPTVTLHSTSADADPVVTASTEQPHSSRTVRQAVFANDCSSSISNNEAPRKQSRRPLLVPNLTKPLTPMISKMKASIPAQSPSFKVYWSPYATPSTIRTEPCANAPRLNSFKTNTNAPIPPIANVSPPPVAQPMNASESAVLVDASIASVAREPRSENLSKPTSSETTPVTPIPSILDATMRATTITAAVQPQQIEPQSSSASVTPSAFVVPKNLMSATPSAPISDSSNISMGAAAATARKLATDTDDFLKKAGADRSCANDLTEEQDRIIAEAPEPGRDLPQPRSGAYAHVPEPIPFSATPSEEEIAALKALRQEQTTRPHPKANINQERSIVKSSLHNSGVKTLELLIESASGEMNLENGFSFDVVMNNTLFGFFSFYAAVSEAPLESFQQLIFTPTWPNCSTTRATKQMGEPGFKRLKKVLQAWYKQAQKADPEEMEFQIMVSMG